MKNKLKLVEESRNQRNEEVKSLKVRVAELEANDAKNKTERAEQTTKVTELQKELEDEKRRRAKVTAELTTYKDDHKIGGNVGGQMTNDQLKERVKELEQDNKILECQKKTVVVYNKEVGSFEYIGEPRPLDMSLPVTNIRDILRILTQWLQTQNRLTVGPIFRSLDKANHGDLKPEVFSQALEKIGITVKDSEMKVLRQYLDTKNCGYLRYEPLVRELQGIRCEEFIIAPLRKLASLCESRDFTRERFTRLIDPRQMVNLSHQEFSEVMMTLNSSDFSITTEEIDQIFKSVTNQDRI